MKLATVLIVFSVFATSGVYAQKKPLLISSAYSNLNKDCKTIGGGDGQDEASDCRGIGGYRIYISPSAASLSISVEPKDRKTSIPIATQSFDFDQRKAKVEWRLAAGKPFAVIMRAAKYADPDDEHPYIGKKIGEELIVRGLKGFESMSFEIDAKTPNANAKAREEADKAYSEMTGKSN